MKLMVLNSSSNNNKSAASGSSSPSTSSAAAAAAAAAPTSSTSSAATTAEKRSSPVKSAAAAAAQQNAAAQAEVRKRFALCHVSVLVYFVYLLFCFIPSFCLFIYLIIVLSCFIIKTARSKLLTIFVKPQILLKWPNLSHFSAIISGFLLAYFCALLYTEFITCTYEHARPYPFRGESAI